MLTRREEKEPHVMSKLLVKDIMNRPVITATPAASAKELADKMSKAKIGSVVIMESDKPVGIVSDWDIVSKASIRDEEPSKIFAKEIMQPLQTVNSEGSVTDAAKLLRKYRTKRLGVTDGKQLVGVVSASDIIAVMPEMVDVVSEKTSMLSGGFGRGPANTSGYCDECDEWSDYLQHTDGRFLCDECREVSRPGEVAPERR